MMPGTKQQERALLKLAGRLTPRDRLVVRAVSDHRVLTTGQICDLAFGSEVTARHRLALLTGLGVLARFRPRLDRGSAPWHYVLDTLGAMVLDTEDDTEADAQSGGHDARDAQKRDKAMKERAARVRRDKSLAVASSPRLAHMVGCNTFFTSLTRTARNQGAEATRCSKDTSRPETTAAGVVWRGRLERWWPARQAEYHLVRSARPDGWGRWREEVLTEQTAPTRQNADEWQSGPKTSLGAGLGAGPFGGVVEFFVEYDTGTENLTQLADKLYGYQEATRQWLAPDHHKPLPWLLFVFTRQGREPAARRALDKVAAGLERHGNILLPIATCVFPAEPPTGGTRAQAAARSPQRVDPAGPIWLPLDSFAYLCGDGRSDPTQFRRLRLAQLGPAYPPAPRDEGRGAW